jgi:hypothetical protein
MKWRIQISLRWLLLLCTLPPFALGSYYYRVERQRQISWFMFDNGADLCFGRWYYRDKSMLGDACSFALAYVPADWIFTREGICLRGAPSDLAVLDKLAEGDWIRCVHVNVKAREPHPDVLNRVLQTKCLTWLILTDVQSVEDAHVPLLAQMSSLQELDIRGTGISEKGLMDIRRAVPNCIVHSD